MTIAATHKASVFSGSNAASYATGSYTPTANRLMIACVENEISGTPTVPTLSGNGLTWSQLVNYACDTSGTQVGITVFVAKSGASPSTGAVTADFGGVTQAGCNVIVDEVDGADLAGTALQAIVQNKTGTVNGSGTSESISLTSAITAGNASYGCFTHQVAEATTFGSGYSELGDGSHSGPASALQTEYKAAGAQTVDASWATSAGKGGVALEIKAVGGLSGTVNQNTETDTSQAIAKTKIKGTGQNTETDLAQAVSKIKSKTLLQNAETDLAQAVARVKVRSVAQVVETDLAQAITRAGGATIVPVAQTTESDLAQALSARKLKAVAEAVETDQAQSVSVRKVKVIAQVIETDSAQNVAVLKARVIAQVTESDLAQVITSVKVHSMAQASESDSAQSIQRLTGTLLQQVEESDLAQALFPLKRVTIAQVVEVEFAQALRSVKIRVVGQALEADLAQAVTISGTVESVLGFAYLSTALVEAAVLQDDALRGMAQVHDRAYENATVEDEPL